MVIKNHYEKLTKNKYTVCAIYYNDYCNDFWVCNEYCSTRCHH